MRASAEVLREELARARNLEGLQGALTEAEETTKTMHSQLSELKFELDKVRKEKQTIELRTAGTSVQQMREDSEHVARLKRDLERANKDHARVVAGFTEKMAWYVSGVGRRDRRGRE